MVFPDHLYIERLVKRLEASGNRSCLRHSDRDVAASDFLNSIFRYARTLDSLSIGRGDVVALLARTTLMRSPSAMPRTSSARVRPSCPSPHRSRIEQS